MPGSSACILVRRRRTPDVRGREGVDGMRSRAVLVAILVWIRKRLQRIVNGGGFASRTHRPNPGDNTLLDAVCRAGVDEEDMLISKRPSEMGSITGSMRTVPGNRAQTSKTTASSHSHPVPR